MRKRSLEIVLSRMKDVPYPSPELEQYRTPAGIVSEVALLASGEGSIERRSVLELGCGGAPFLVAAGLLGAERLVGVDIDPDAVMVAKENIAEVDASLGTDLSSRSEIIGSDVKDFKGTFDTVFMNPPFGAQRKGADRPFLEAATRCGGEVYSLHNSKGIEFVRRFFEGSGYSTVLSADYRFPIPHRFSFHTEETAHVTVVLLLSRKGKTV